MKRIVASLATCAALAGCAPAPTPAPAPQPTWTCTPETGGDPYICNERDHQTMQAKDALYREAEQVYREFMAEWQKVMLDVSAPTDQLLSLTTGDFQESMRTFIETERQDGIRTQGAITIKNIKRAPGISKLGSIVAIEACSDWSGITTFTPNQKPFNGVNVKVNVFFRQESGALKIVTQDGSKGPSVC